MENVESRGSFSGKMGFILAAAGSAVGLGNLWRFPYLAEEYGGGIFLITYLVLAFTFGICLMITEIAIGRRTGKSAILAFIELSEKYKILGLLATIVPILIVPYYCVIGGWVTKYFFEYATGSGAQLAGSTFFDSFTMSGSLLEGPFIWFIIFAAITLFVVMFSVEKGVERVSKVLMPALLVVLVCIAGYMMTLPNIGDGLSYYLVPDFEQFSMKTVLGALGQLFYSLSLAMGVLITYGSYMKRSVNIPKASATICLTDSFVAFLSGLIVVPAVIVFSSEGLQSGSGLLFETMPLVFQNMPAGFVIGTLFFALAFFAALTSSISLAEAVVSSFRDRFRMPRLQATIICLILVLGLGALSCLGYGPLNAIQPLGMAFLDFFDFITNSVLMPILAFMISIMVGHLLTTRFVTDEVEGKITDEGALCDVATVDTSGFGHFPTKGFYIVMIRWVCPVGILLILITGLLSFFGIYTI